MRVVCRHGHFAFYPRNEIEVSRFNAIFNQPLFRDEDFYTFALLKAAPTYSLKGKAYLGATALVSYASSPWEILRQNGFVYDFTEMTLRPKAQIVSVINLAVTEDYWAADAPLIQAGGFDSSGQKIVSYDGEIDLQTSQLRLFEVEYD